MSSVEEAAYGAGRTYVVIRQQTSSARLFLWLLPLWLLGLWFGPMLKAPWSTPVQLVALLWIVPFAMWQGKGRFLTGPAFHQDQIMAFLSAMFLLSATVSGVLSGDPFFALGMVAAFGVGLMICTGLWGVAARRMTTMVSAYSVLGTALAVAFYLERDVRQARFGGVLHPNSWGLISFGLGVSGLLLESRWLRVLVVGVNAYLILEAQSRSAFLGLLISGLTYYAVRMLRERGGPKWRAVRLWMVITAIVWLVTDPTGHVEAAFVQAFHLDDTSRGFETGIGGRFEAWRETIDAFAANPFFGVGVRMHERYVTALSSAHNGYLAVLADVGLLGGIALYGLILHGTFRLVRLTKSGRVEPRFGLALLTGYCALALFEARLLNVGNPTSILAWLFLLQPSLESTEVRQLQALPRDVILAARPHQE
jgi:O-antigen ligase